MTMRRHTALMVILVMLGVMTGGAAAQAQTIEASPAFRAIHMVSTTNGWAVVTVRNTSPAKSYPSPGQIYPGTLASVLHTEDGGQHWTDVSPDLKQQIPDAGSYGCDCSDNGLAGFFFLDDSHAWVIANDAQMPGNPLFYGLGVRSTSDGGKTWVNPHRILNAPYVLYSSFTDPLHGWLLLGGVPEHDGTEPALLYRSTDGGLSWELVSDDGSHTHIANSQGDAAEPISPVDTGLTSLFHTGMAFESENSGWLLGTDFDPGDSDVRHTTDGGVTWKMIQLTADASDKHTLGDCIVSELSVLTPGMISFLDSCHYGVMVMHQSSDDGATWQAYPIPTDVINQSEAEMLFMLNGLTGWSVGCEATVACNDPGLAHVLYKTVDDGINWDEIGKLPKAFQSAANEVTLFAPQFDFVDEQIGWAIAPAGGLYTTTDGGKSWTEIAAEIAGI